MIPTRPSFTIVWFSQCWVSRRWCVATLNSSLSPWRYLPYRPSSLSGELAFSNRAPLMWNTLPRAMQQVSSSTSFKKLYLEWRLFIFISRESKWGTLQSAGNPRCAVPAEIHSICTDRPRPGPAAGLQVSPTSDTSQSVAILMNRPHY